MHGDSTPPLVYMIMVLVYGFKMHSHSRDYGAHWSTSEHLTPSSMAIIRSLTFVFLTSGAGSDLELSCCSVPSPSVSACPTCMNDMHTKTLIYLLFIQRFMSVPKRHSSAPAMVLPYASAWLPGSTSEQEQRFEGSTC